MFPCVNCSTSRASHGAHLLLHCILESTSPGFMEEWWNYLPDFHSVVKPFDCKEDIDRDNRLQILGAALRLLLCLTCLSFVLTELDLWQHHILASQLHLELMDSFFHDKNVNREFSQTSVFLFLYKEILLILYQL